VVGLIVFVGDECELERSLSTALVVAVSSLGTRATSSLIWTTLGLTEATESLSHSAA